VIAGNKAFIVNRIGDFGFLLGILLLLTELGRQGIWTLEFAELQKNIQLLSPQMITAITVLLFVGATGKSAQIPLFVWLPDAMAGPTPVSALIHAATMVTAGVYMTARLHFLYSLAPSTLELIAWIGAATALLAATIALVQNDIKKVLAYSTISQLGYMFLAVGLGAFPAAIFHVFTHAFFKACLFLGAGSVIHALGGEQDMRKMGGLRSHMPTTYRTYVIAALAISGAPLTAGFFSKDLILWQAFSHGELALWMVGLITAGMTAFYMFRQLFMVFHGELRAGEHLRAHLHESPQTMTLPLVVLSLGSIFAGWLGAPEYLWGSWWQRWFTPVFGAPQAHHGSVESEILVTAATLALAGMAIYLAYARYGRQGAVISQDAAGRGSALYRVLLNKYYIDELYDRALVRPFTAGSNWLARVFDPQVIDGIANGIAGSARRTSVLWQRLQTGNVQHYLVGFLVGILALLGYYIGQP
jgi:NADH-quinone oxidoreductase subunit L